MHIKQIYKRIGKPYNNGAGNMDGHRHVS